MSAHTVAERIESVRSKIFAGQAVARLVSKKLDDISGDEDSSVIAELTAELSSALDAAAAVLDKAASDLYEVQPAEAQS